MAKYYLVPVTDSSLFFDNVSLKELLKYNFLDLYKMDDKRIEILYSSSPLFEMSQKEVERYNKHIEETNLLYKAKNIPRLLVCKGNDMAVREVITGNIISSEYSAALHVRQVKTEIINKYLEDTNYSEMVNNYFSNLDKRSNKVVSFVKYKTRKNLINKRK